MKKKNTLLYLDRDLVEKAKKADINISRLAEEALIRELKWAKPTTVEGHLQKLLSEGEVEIQFHGSSFYGERYFLPFQIQTLKLTKIWPFDEFEMHFRKNSINVIFGNVVPEGSLRSSKSTIVWSILLAFGVKHRYFFDTMFSAGAITLKLFPGQDSINLTGAASSGNARGYQCLLADDLIENIPKDMIAPLFTELKRLGIQIIMTTSLPIDTYRLPEEAQLIPLPESVQKETKK